MSKDGAWRRPQHHLAAFYPATADGWLVSGINKIMKEEGERIGLRITSLAPPGHLPWLPPDQPRPLRVPIPGLPDVQLGPESSEGRAGLTTPGPSIYAR